MDFDSVVEKRVSVRSFKNKKASWKDILEAIDAAIKAPSAGKMHHFKFVVIEDQEKINKIAELADQLWISESGILVVVCSDDTHLENQYGERGRVYSRQAAGAAIENFLLKIADLGLSACWVGSYTDELIKQLLKIPEHIQIEAIIPVGYAKTKTSSSKKQKLENVLRWEDWNTWNRPSLYKEPSIRKPTPSSIIHKEEKQVNALRAATLE